MSAPSNNPFAWLGLLKWSLSYSDGTRPSSESCTPLSDEDKAFLEAVMREGIIDENERMKTLLKELTLKLESWKTEPARHEDIDQVEEWLQEVRDIVEQIDYARALAAMKGLPFLLGCAMERELMPNSVRSLCLGIVATMCQHNPPVQKELLEMGAIQTLSDLCFVETNENSDSNGSIRSKAIQAISAMVRSNDLAESVFSQLEQSTYLLEMGLGIATEEAHERSPPVLQKRTLFFLRALVTSDTATVERIQRFSNCIAWSALNLIDLEKEDDCELRETTLAMMVELLEQRKNVTCLLDNKRAIIGIGVRCVTALRALTGDDREYAQAELDLWEHVIQKIARVSINDSAATTDNSSQPLLIGQGSPSDQNEFLSQ
jgi:hsp70-interacting protein